MNLETINRASGAALGLMMVGVVFAALTLAVKFSLHPPLITADRDAVRTKALSEMTATENAALAQPAWIDPAHGIVRLPLETALQLAAQQWQNPAAARADLLARQAKASAELPQAPEKPSAFG